VTDTVKDITRNPIKGAAMALGAGAAMPMGAVGMFGGAKAGAAVAGMKNPFGSNVNVPDATARPEWNLSGPDGKLRSDLMLGGAMPVAAGQSQSVLNKLQDRATMTGPSQSAQYLMDANKRTMENSLGQADQAMQGQMANTVSSMAMRGGVDAGSRERLGKGFGFENLMNRQRIMNDARGADLNILAGDEKEKLGLMQALPANLLAQAGFEQDGKRFDISNTLSAVGGKYSEDMKGWAANQAAREQAQLANKKNGLLGLGIGGIL
jgi:hypothetical protein